jgi:hypothetical protein
LTAFVVSWFLPLVCLFFDSNLPGIDRHFEKTTVLLLKEAAVLPDGALI